jgi:hypothetical protein
MIRKWYVSCRNAHEPDNVAPLAWDESAVTSDDPEFGGKGARDTGEGFHAAPDIDHTNEMVQAGLKDFCKCASLDALRDASVNITAACFVLKAGMAQILPVLMYKSQHESRLPDRLVQNVHL